MEAAQPKGRLLQVNVDAVPGQRCGGGKRKVAEAEVDEEESDEEESEEEDDEEDEDGGETDPGSRPRVLYPMTRTRSFKDPPLSGHRAVVLLCPCTGGGDWRGRHLAGTAQGAPQE